MHTTGIIGGFSPESTALFYTKLVKTARLRGFRQLPHIIMWNVPVPNTVEHDLILHGAGLSKITPLLIHAARGLERAGADFIVFPCNTLHAVADDLRSSIHIPFLDIIETSVDHLRSRGIKRVGLLGTQLTLTSNLFARRSEEILFTKPSEILQQQMTRAIHTSVISNDNRPMVQLLTQSINEFTNNDIHDVLLACTDFSGSHPAIPDVTFHDTLSILADETIHQLTHTFYKFTPIQEKGVLPC